MATATADAKFGLMEEVEWDLPGGGAKRGFVVLKVPVNVHVDRFVLDKLGPDAIQRLRRGKQSNRPHESYLVGVRRKPAPSLVRYYWPPVAALRKAR